MNHILLFCDSRNILEFSNCLKVEFRNDYHPHSCYALLNSLVDEKILSMIECERCLIILNQKDQKVSEIEVILRRICVTLSVDYEINELDMPIDDNMLSMSIKSYLERRLFTRFEYFKIGEKICYKENNNSSSIFGKFNCISFSLQIRHKCDNKNISFIFIVESNVYHYKQLIINNNNIINTTVIYAPTLDFVDIKKISIDKSNDSPLLLLLPKTITNKKRGFQKYIPNNMKEYIEFYNLYYMYRINENSFKGYALINQYSISEICVLNCLYSYITLSYVDTQLNQIKIIHKFCIGVEEILRELKYNPNEIKPFQNKYQISKASLSFNGSISPICWSTIENKEKKRKNDIYISTNEVKNPLIKENKDEDDIKLSKIVLKSTKSESRSIKCRFEIHSSIIKRNEKNKKIKSVRFSTDNNTCYFNENDPSINISKDSKKGKEEEIDEDFLKDFDLSE